VLNGGGSTSTNTRRVSISLVVALSVAGCGSGDSAERALTDESLIVYQITLETGLYASYDSAQPLEQGIGVRELNGRYHREGVSAAVATPRRP